nr:serine hydrolase domain-containing protein [uncultured Flavobacterium sp.]
MKKYIRQNFLLLLLFITIGSPAQLLSAQNLETKIDSVLLTVFKDNKGPGGVFLVAQKGKPIYQKAFGKANVLQDIDLTPKSVFQLGSITKQFTTVAILMLEEQGKLNVNNPVSKYIPDYPSGDKITLHHLLTHTSGIKDFTKMKALKDIAQKDLSPKEMVDFFKNETVDFAPGEKFEYSNSGYIVLGYIIELVSGTTYENYINTHIFKKLKMNNSRYANDDADIANRAYGYHKKENDYVDKRKISFNIPFSSGALMSTADDMLKWQNALNRNLLLKSNTMKKAYTKYTLNNGEAFTYGYGWHLKEIDAVAVREHGGSIFGFKTMGVYVPEIDVYVIGFSNCDCNSPTQAARDIAAMTIKELKKQ